MEQEKPKSYRFQIASTAGIIVAFLSTIAAWLQWGRLDNVRYAQADTKFDLRHAARAVEEYREQEGKLPDDWSDLEIPFDTDGPYKSYHIVHPELGTLHDCWDRPIEYTTDGETFQLKSFGQDGKPGGRGLDYDLTHDNLNASESFPTYYQFLFECSTEGILITSCLASGIITFFMTLVIAESKRLYRKKAIRIIIDFAITAIGALVVALILSILHIPTGH